MLAEPTTNQAADADPIGPGGDGVRPDSGGAAPRESDPIFQAKEPTEPTPKSTQLLWQFFFFPLLVVGAAVGLFVVVGWLAGRNTDPEKLLKDFISGGENEGRQSMHQLGLLIRDEREKAERAQARDPEGKEAREPAFYERPGFRESLRVAFQDALSREGVSEERLVFLANTLGATAFPGTDAEVSANLDALARALYPTDSEKAPPSTLRHIAALAVGDTASRLAEPLLVRMAGDRDMQVREIAFWGLMRLASPLVRGGTEDGPDVRPALVRGLEDTSNGVRLWAALGLAARGDPAGRDLVVRSLSRAGLTDLGIRDAMHTDALVNAIHAAAGLGDEDLKERVQKLANDDKSEEVRARARAALSHWRNG